MNSMTPGQCRWLDGLLAARLLALDPVGLGGAVVRSPPGPTRDQWYARLTAWLPSDTPHRKLPITISNDRLLGGIDLASALQSQRAQFQPGILASCDGGVLTIPLAERLQATTASHIAATIDAGAVIAIHAKALPREARFAVIAFDEGDDSEERAPRCLTDRLAFEVDLSAVSMVDALPLEGGHLAQDDTFRANAPALLVSSVTIDTALVTELCEAAAQLGIGCLRTALHAVRCARVHAALKGRTNAAPEDALVAARLVLAPRAKRLPAAAPQTPSPPEEIDEPGKEQKGPSPAHGPLADILVATAKAALPSGLVLGALEANNGGLEGATRSSKRIGRGRGRQVGARRGDPRTGARLDFIETLKAAAPWQTLRGRTSAADRFEIRRSDMHVRMLKPHTVATTIFVVDASGSTAAQRLGEAKGAVELLLSECYVRRDQVAMLGFRHDKAEILLPPTRALARARRSLSCLPGGGGTPLASAIVAGLSMASAVRRAGQSPFLVFLTDGGANITRDGRADRARAEKEALCACGLVREARVPAAVIDTAQFSRPLTLLLAETMGARYLALPRADADALAHAVRVAQPRQPSIVNLHLQ